MFLAGLTAAAPDDCTGPELKSFDFLVGEWVEKDGAGKMRIEKILDGCGIREDWMLEGFNAILVRTYDSSKGVWHLSFAAHDLEPQVWNGKLENGTWVFYRDWELKGEKRRSRTFWKVTADGFVKIVEQLNDDKKTWRLHDRSEFVRKTPKRKHKSE